MTCQHDVWNEKDKETHTIELSSINHVYWSTIRSIMPFTQRLFPTHILGLSVLLQVADWLDIKKCWCAGSEEGAHLIMNSTPHRS